MKNIKNLLEDITAVGSTSSDMAQYTEPLGTKPQKRLKKKKKSFKEFVKEK